MFQSKALPPFVNRSQEVLLTFPGLQVLSVPLQLLEALVAVTAFDQFLSLFEAVLLTSTGVIPVLEVSPKGTTRQCHESHPDPQEAFHLLFWSMTRNSRPIHNTIPMKMMTSLFIRPP